MAQKFHIKRNEADIVIAGAHKGKQGKLLEIRSSKNRAVVEGVAMIKRHLKKSQENPQGKIAEREGTIHVSNLMLQARFDPSSRNKNQSAAATPAPEAPAAKPKAKAKAKA